MESNEYSFSTPIDSLESGDVKLPSDQEHMAAILAEINEAPTHGFPSPPQTSFQGAGPVQITGAPQPMPPQMGATMLPPQMLPMGVMPQMVQPQIFTQQQQPIYTPVQTPEKPAMNGFGSFTKLLSEPLMVASIVFLMSLPALNTFLTKYASWAYNIGGELSWGGLVVKAVLSGVLFFGLKSISHLFS
jgi:hypothetical protein